MFVFLFFVCFTGVKMLHLRLWPRGETEFLDEGHTSMYASGLFYVLYFYFLVFEGSETCKTELSLSTLCKITCCCMTRNAGLCYKLSQRHKHCADWL